MTTELTRSSEDRAPVLVTSRGLVPTNFEDLWRMAKAVAASGLAPRDMKTVEQVFVAMAHGMEIGLKPMQSLQRIAVINGRPTIYGDAMIGLVRASGKLERFEESFAGKEGGNDYRAVCVAKRRDSDEVLVEYSIGDAKTAGLWGKSGPWSSSPKRMLQMRARAFALRDLFADVLGGLYMTEEIIDTGPSHDSTGDDRAERMNANVRRVANEAEVPQVPADEPRADPEPSEEPDAAGADERPHPDMPDRHRGPPIDLDELPGLRF